MPSAHSRRSSGFASDFEMNKRTPHGQFASSLCRPRRKQAIDTARRCGPLLAMALAPMPRVTPRTAWTRRRLGHGCPLLCEDGRCGEALAVFGRALEYFSDDCQLHFNRAVALEELDRADDALNGYRMCLAIEPGYADAHYNPMGRYLQPSQVLTQQD